MWKYYSKYRTDLPELNNQSQFSFSFFYFFYFEKYDFSLVCKTTGLFHAGEQKSIKPWLSFYDPYHIHIMSFAEPTQHDALATMATVKKLGIKL